MLRGKATEESTFDTGRTVVGQPLCIAFVYFSEKPRELRTV